MEPFPFPFPWKQLSNVIFKEYNRLFQENHSQNVVFYLKEYMEYIVEGTSFIQKFNVVLKRNRRKLFHLRVKHAIGLF